MLIMIDGIEGGGKSTIIEAWKKYLTDQNKTFFDLKKYCLENNKYPDYTEIAAYDFIFSAEPTYFGIGKTIREELIKNGTSYPETAVAQAYSLDRLILYTKILIPALRDNKTIIQDRGVSTSLCYQALSQNLSIETLVSLPGNALALQYRPDYLVLTDMSPETAQKRLATRYDKQDDAIFDRIDFQQQAATRYKSNDFQKLFTDRGTIIEYLNTDVEIDIMKQNSLTTFTRFINQNS
jgi:thymidylate kinase